MEVDALASATADCKRPCLHRQHAQHVCTCRLCRQATTEVPGTHPHIACPAPQCPQLTLNPLDLTWRRIVTQLTVPCAEKNSVSASIDASIGSGRTYTLRASFSFLTSSGSRSGALRFTRVPSALISTAWLPRSASAAAATKPAGTVVGVTSADSFSLVFMRLNAQMMDRSTSAGEAACVVCPCMHGVCAHGVCPRPEHTHIPPRSRPPSRT